MAKRKANSVCIVAPLPPPYGGMRLQARKLIDYLVEEGCNIQVIATNPQAPRFLKWVRAIPGLRSLICEVQYLIHLVRVLPRANTIHHFSASGLNFFLRSAPVLIFGRFLRKKIILNYRGGNAPDFLRQWHWCVVPVARLADRIVVPSGFLQDVFRDYGLRASILPNIADTNLFSWQSRRRFTPRLLVTRHLEPTYNVECLLRALRIVQTCFPEAALTIAGGGSEENRLRDLVRKWELQGVRFCGPVAHHELPSLYASHDIYVNSSNIDNFPGALVEAACCGLPIVTTRAGGIPQMICDRQNGILVDLNDHISLAAAIVEIAKNPVLGQSLARQARLWAEQYSWPNIFPLLLDYYGMPTPVGRVYNLGIAQREEVGRREFVR